MYWYQASHVLFIDLQDNVYLVRYHYAPADILSSFMHNSIKRKLNLLLIIPYCSFLIAQNSTIKYELFQYISDKAMAEEQVKALKAYLQEKVPNVSS